MTEPFSSYLVRLVIALLIGGAVGLEREFRGKPAGMRTNMLICIGSCLIMIISIEIARGAARTADPGFALTRPEAGHPLWGPVYRQVVP